MENKGDGRFRRRLSLHGDTVFRIIPAVLFLLCFLPVQTIATPQFALLNGERCASCHANAAGGGIRTKRGFFEMNRTGMIQPRSIGIKSLGDDRNTILNDRIALGTDLRFQTVRSPKSADVNRRYFPMQASAYSTFRIFTWLRGEASYNFGPKKYFGQEKWTASAIIQPENSSSQLRAGFFRPSIGIRYDDHTVIANQVAGGDYTSLIPPAYAEYGAEYTFNGIEWLTATAGAFSARNLAEVRATNAGGGQISLITNRDRPSALLRMELHSPAAGDAVYIQGGSSWLANGDFNMENLFLGAGFGHRVSVLGEFIHSEKRHLQHTNNGTLDLTCRVARPLLLFVRAERGVTRNTRELGNVKTYMNLGTAGAEIFLFPHIELRPEFRIVDTEKYRSTRYYAQIHLFY